MELTAPTLTILADSQDSEDQVKVYSILLSALLAAILALGPGEVTDQAPPLTPDASPRIDHTLPPEPPSAEVELGDLAPDFAYQGDDNRWRRLHDLLQQGPVLLVFSTDPAVLTALERERDAMLKLGAIPVALLDVRNGVAWATARRHGLHYLVIPDSRRVIASQFHALDQNGERLAPSWFVVDRGGRVRALRRGSLPEQGYAQLTAIALGLPDPGVTVTTGNSRR
jgi:peroxiredoxin